MVLHLPTYSSQLTKSTSLLDYSFTMPEPSISLRDLPASHTPSDRHHYNRLASHGEEMGWELVSSVIGFLRAPMSFEEEPSRSCAGREPTATIIPKPYKHFAWVAFILYILGNIPLFFAGLPFTILILVVLLLFVGPYMILSRLVRRLLHFLKFLEASEPIPYGTLRSGYLSLEPELGAFRLLELLPGTQDDDIHANLYQARFSDRGYRALSHAWQTAPHYRRPTRPRVYIDGHIQVLSASLTRALSCIKRSLRQEGLWIDNLCIDQSNMYEKSEQVKAMLDIYRHADEVLVWLDIDTVPNDIQDADIQTLFAKIRNLSDDLETRIEIVQSLRPTEKSALECILSLNWWHRTWVVQEVVANPNVTFLCRGYTVPWIYVSRLIRPGPIPHLAFDMPKHATLFITRVDELKTSADDPQYGLLALLHRFSTSKVTINRDRLYALQGLLKSANNMLDFPINYEMSEDAIFTKFTTSHIKQYQSLAALIDVEQDGSHELPSLFRKIYIFMEGLTEFHSYFFRTNLGDGKDVKFPSWVTSRDLSLKTRTGRIALWDAGLDGRFRDAIAGDSEYCAAGASNVRCNLGLPDPEVLAVQGWRIDTIAAVGKTFEQEKDSASQKEQITGWENVAGGPWAGDNEDLRSRFAETITASDNLNPELRDWRSWFGEERNQSLVRLRIVCTGRRFFLTSTGLMGLGHCGTRTGDLVCVLLGASVPYTLRQSKHDSHWTGYHSGRCRFSGTCERQKHLDCCLPPLYCLIGQAYVHGRMQYSGDVDEDIERGQIKLETFGLE